MAMKIYTKLVTVGNPFTLTEDYKAVMFSFQVSGNSGDNATYIGNMNNPVTQAASEAIPQAAGQGQVFVSDNPTKPVSGITITAIQGTVAINIGY